MSNAAAAIHDFVATHGRDAEQFLAALVKIPSDNPPGDCAPHALEAANGVLTDLYALRKTYASTRSKIPGIASPTLVVDLIRGSITTNLVPDNVTFRIDRRIVEANGHRADEKLSLADLHKATEVVALALADLLASV